jgi:hypothetical protein
MNIATRLRAIEYEIWRREEAVKRGLVAEAADDHLEGLDEVAVLKCVDDRGQKFTAFGDVKHLHGLLASGEARDPAGMTLSPPAFPIVLSGWLQAS